jgi:RNA polymerase sigma-70 factor (ECF subfamily)
VNLLTSDDDSANSHPDAGSGPYSGPAAGLPAARFEEHRSRLRAVGYRMLGSLSEADDAVQEAWLRLNRTGSDRIGNLGGWLTTVTARVCLDMLRSRTFRREEPLETYLPDPVVSAADGLDPEQEALLADCVGLALLVVLDTLAPAERLAFVLHDMFAVPYDDIAPVVGRSPAAARQLASRARRRVQGANADPDPDLGRQRAVADAFLAASRGGDFDALVAVLDPDVVLRSDVGAGIRGVSQVLRGAETVARQALLLSGGAAHVRPVLVNGVAGTLTASGGTPMSVMAFTVRGGRITQIHILADPPASPTSTLTSTSRRVRRTRERGPENNAPGHRSSSELAGLVVAGGLPDDDVQAVEGVDDGDDRHQGGELLLVVVLGGVRPGLVRDPAGRVSDAGGLLRQLQGRALGVGEHRGLSPGRDQVEAHRGLPGVRGVFGVHVGAEAAAVDLTGAEPHQLPCRGRQRRVRHHLVRRDDVPQGLGCERAVEEVQAGFHGALLAVVSGYTSMTGQLGEM